MYVAATKQADIARSTQRRRSLKALATTGRRFSLAGSRPVQRRPAVGHCTRGDASHQHPVRRTRHGSSPSSVRPCRRRATGNRRSPSSRASPASARPASSVSLERAARDQGVRVLTGECVDLGEGEAPVRSHRRRPAPADPCGRPGAGIPPLPARDALRSMLPGLAGAAIPHERIDEAATARSRLFEALLELLDRLSADKRAAAVHRGHATGRTARRARSSPTWRPALCRDARAGPSPPYRPDELHRRHPLRPVLAELERDSHAPPHRAAPFTREELSEQLCDILGSPAGRGGWWTACGRARRATRCFAEELLAARARRPRRHAADRCATR